MELPLNSKFCNECGAPVTQVRRSAEQKQFWPMVRKAAKFLSEYGPATELDRWEEKGGYNAYSLGTVFWRLSQ